MPKKIEGQTDEKAPKSVCSQWTLSIGAGESRDQQFSSLDWKPLQAWGTSMLDIGVTVGQNVLIHFSIKTIHKSTLPESYGSARCFDHECCISLDHSQDDKCCCNVRADN